MSYFQHKIACLSCFLVFSLCLGSCGRGEGVPSPLSVSEESQQAETQFSESEGFQASEPEEEPQPRERESIRVVNLFAEDPFLSERVAEFAREHPDYEIEYSDTYEEDMSKRVLTETASGDGPDLLYLTRQDMRSLYEQDALGEIGGLLQAETREALLPAAVSMGTCGDRLTALPLSVTVRTLLTSRKYWQGEGWTPEDVLSVLDAKPEIEGMFLDVAGTDDYYYNMRFLLGMDLMQSPFIREGRGCFDSPEFRRLLSVIKEKTKNAVNNSLPWDRTLPLTEGSYLGVEYMVSTMLDYCKIREALGEDTNLAGYPGYSGGGHYLFDNGMLAVNANAADKEGVRELVNALLDLESQRYQHYVISVRTDIPADRLVYDESGREYIWTSPNNHGFTLPAKEDGSSYEEEYLTFLKSAVPAPENFTVFDMIFEEADSYFSSQKDLDEAVSVIQNRVQLYLDENG